MYLIQYFIIYLKKEHIEKLIKIVIGFKQISSKYFAKSSNF